MFCRHCGKQISNAAVFCSFCGNPLNAPFLEEEMETNTQSVAMANELIPGKQDNLGKNETPTPSSTSKIVTFFNQSSPWFSLFGGILAIVFLLLLSNMRTESNFVQNDGGGMDYVSSSLFFLVSMFISFFEPLISYDLPISNKDAYIVASLTHKILFGVIFAVIICLVITLGIISIVKSSRAISKKVSNNASLYSFASLIIYLVGAVLFNWINSYQNIISTTSNDHITNYQYESNLSLITVVCIVIACLILLFFVAHALLQSNKNIKATLMPSINLLLLLGLLLGAGFCFVTFLETSQATYQETYVFTQGFSFFATALTCFTFETTPINIVICCYLSSAVFLVFIFLATITIIKKYKQLYRAKTEDGVLLSCFTAGASLFYFILFIITSLSLFSTAAENSIINISSCFVILAFAVLYIVGTFLQQHINKKNKNIVS